MGVKCDIFHDMISIFSRFVTLLSCFSIVRFSFTVLVWYTFSLFKSKIRKTNNKRLIPSKYLTVDATVKYIYSDATVYSS